MTCLSYGLSCFVISTSKVSSHVFYVIRADEDYDFSGCSGRNAAIAAAHYASTKIYAVVEDHKDSSNCPTPKSLIGRPLCKVKNPKDIRLTVTADPKVLYPKFIRSPLYRDEADWFSRQTLLEFWLRYRLGAEKTFEKPTVEGPLPITTSFSKKSRMDMIETFFTHSDNFMEDFIDRLYKNQSRGYPEPSLLQNEQLLHVRNLLDGVGQLSEAVRKEDLARLMALIDAMKSTLNSIQHLGELGYRLRFSVMEKLAREGRFVM